MSQDADSLAQAVTDGDHVLLTLLRLARLRGWEPDFLAYRNSGDVSGDRDRVVGYASIVFGEPFSLTAAERKDLLTYARRVIEEHVRTGATSIAGDDLLARHPISRIPRAVFVTLKKGGELRGCIGDLVSSAPMLGGIQKCAISAATKDHRFQPVTEDELDDLTVSISVLTFPRKVEVAKPEDYLKVLRPGRDGVILVCQGRRSTFLPSVWEQIPEPREFLARLCEKQGSPPDCWLDPATVLFRYGSYEFGEGD